MSRANRIIVVLLLACAAAAVFALKNKQHESAPPATEEGPSVVTPDTPSPAEPQAPPAAQPLPRLVDLGAGKCIPCKMMAPILEELKKEHADTFDVEFIDVWENPGAGEKYGIRMIPTQIFYDCNGRELFRHEGFFGKADILAKWKEHGVATAAGTGE